MSRKPGRQPDSPTDTDTRYSSPPCYAGDFPGHFGEEMPTADALRIERLNALLEAERAGAKVLAILRDELDARAPLRALLERLQKDEGSNAVVLYKTIQSLGGVASHETGAFVHKTLAIEGLEARLRFLNKGQAWVVHKIDELLPDVEDGALRSMLETMRRSHVDNIAACEAVLEEGLAAG